MENPINGLEWLNAAKNHISTSSKPWRLFRSQAVQELSKRLNYQLNPAHFRTPQDNVVDSKVPNKPLRDWTLQDRLELSNAVENAIKNSGPEIFSAALEDVKHIIQGHFHKFVHNETLSKKNGGIRVGYFGNRADGSFGEKLVEAKIETAINESEMAVCSLLSKWPDSKDIMKIAVNVPLPSELRKTAWRACLLDIELRQDSNKLQQTTQQKLIISNQIDSSFLDASFLSESQSWKRRMSVIVPFVKVFEFDWIRKKIENGLQVLNEDKNLLRKHHTGFDAIETNEFENVKREQQGDFYREGLGGLKQASEEDAKTARIAEMATSFWDKMPEHWHADESFTWDKITFEVEKCLLEVDKTLHSHIGMLVAGDQEEFPHTLDSMKLVVKRIVGDLFVDICQIDVVLFIFDQFITSSYEFTKDIILPPFDLWVSWIVVGIILILKEPFMICNKLIKTEVLNQVTVKKLQQQLEKNFVGALRSRLITSSPVHLNLLLGYDHRISKNQKGYDKYWDKDYKILDEDKIIEWENEGGDGARIEIERWEMRKRIEEKERIATLLTRWRSKSKAIGIAMRFIIGLQEMLQFRKFQIISLERALMKPGWLTPNQSPRESATTRVPTPLPPKPDTPPPKVEIEFPEPVEQAKEEKKKSEVKPPVLKKPPEKVKKVEIKRKLKKKEVKKAVQLPKYPLSTSKLCTEGTIAGQELKNLTGLGSMIVSVIDRTQYIFGGDFQLPTTIDLISHSNKFKDTIKSEFDAALRTLSNNGPEINFEDIERIENQDEFFKNLDNIRINNNSKKHKMHKTDLNKASELERILAVETLKDQISTMDRLNNLPGIVGLVFDKIETIISVNHYLNTSTILSSLTKCHLFQLNEETAQKLIFNKILDKTFDKFDGLYWYINHVDLELHTLISEEEKITELERRKLRDLYFKKLDELNYADNADVAMS
ncbi:hypothetical protein HDU92_005286 [Lobulomyces angularis]|nr:hypothetical protein HDU92_005286 [Lobulomyces angularis]